MTDNEAVDLSTDEFVEYCRTQAGLLSGRLEELGAEVAEALAELETETADLQERLERQQERASELAETAEDEAALEAAVTETEERQTEIAAKQEAIETKQARMNELEELAEGYADLADELESGDYDGREAMEEVIQFEAVNDAPRYFEETKTVFEAATES